MCVMYRDLLDLACGSHRDCGEAHLASVLNARKIANIICIFARLFVSLQKVFSFDSVMKKVQITAVRQTVYPDLMAKYENPIEHACEVTEGQQWISVDGRCPEGMCPSAWNSMREFVEALARGEGNFYDGWMQNPASAMISCNDGFRPFSFYIEALDD